MSSNIKLALARENFQAYCATMDDKWQAGQHHKAIAAALEAVEKGQIKRLMVFCPPRHGKSMMCSQSFPAWYLGRNPDKYIITATYSQDLATDFGRSVRNQMRDDEYIKIFGDLLATDSAAQDRLGTVKNGSYFAVGVGGSVTGRGANLLLIDDPIKNRDEADSATTRRRVKDWYSSAAYTRLMPNASIVIIQTRWHDDDLSGWLLKEHAHENWAILNFPALAEDDDVLGRKPGDALWPAFYDETALHRIRRTIFPRDWSALYQQRPQDKDGDFFTRDMIQYYTELPENLRYYAASDYAVSDGKGDYTVHGIIGVDTSGDIYVVDWWRKQAKADEWIDHMMRLGKKYPVLAWAEEQGQIIKGVGPFIEKTMNETRVFIYRKQFASTKDKATRARSIQGFMAKGKVYFPKDKAWTNDLVEEMISFPAGKNDDQVDVMSLFGRMLSSMRSAIPTQKHKEIEINTEITFNDLHEALDNQKESEWERI